MNGHQSSPVYFHLPNQSTATPPPLNLSLTSSSAFADMDVHRQPDEPLSDEALRAIRLTQDLELTIYGYVMPVVNTIGIVAAIVCIIVFTRKQMRSSLNVYLAGLSIFDLLVLVMGLLIYPPMTHCVTSEMNKPNTTLDKEPPSFICVFFWRTALATYPLSVTAQAGSVWTCVAITIDRFLAVKYPLHMRFWCTPQKAVCVLSAIALFSAVYKFPTVFELTNDDDGRLTPTSLRTDEYYKKIYTTYSYLLILFLIPWAIMIVLNIIVIRAVHAAYRIRRTMTSSRHSTSEDRERRCTIMAMIIIVTFVIFNLVASINNFVEASFGEPNPTHEPMRFVWQRAAVFVGNLLICVNSSSNFCIYCLFGRRFRQMCVLIFCPCLVAKNLGYQSFMINANGTMRSTQGSDAGGAVSKDIMALRRLNHSNRALSSDHAVMHGSNGSSFRSKPSPATQRRKRSSDVLLLHHSGNKYTSRLCGTGSVTEQVV